MGYRYSFVHFSMYYLGTLIITFGMATLMNVLVELPCSTIQAYWMGGRAKISPKKKLSNAALLNDPAPLNSPQPDKVPYESLVDDDLRNSREEGQLKQQETV